MSHRSIIGKKSRSNRNNNAARLNCATAIESLETRLFLSHTPVVPIPTASSVSTPTIKYFSKTPTFPFKTNDTPVNDPQVTFPGPWTPAQIRQAYLVNSILFGAVTGDGSGQTVAIVDAFDDPKFISSTDPNFTNNSLSDLHQFCSDWGLQQFGVAGGPTFTKLNQTGGTSYPAANAGWAGEIALDVEWVHVIAPKANIVLVEATSNSTATLNQVAVPFAASISGVSAVTMSYGAGEFSGETSYDSNFVTPAGHQGVTFLASTGDNGAPAGYPSYSPNVVAVGGTQVHSADSAGTYTNGAEVGWSGGGGGISVYEGKPTYQSTVTQSATARTVPDISFDADPNSGVYTLDSYNGGVGAYYQVGGTSLSSPCWAGLIAIANQGRVINGLGTMNGTADTLPKIYALAATDFHDITSGNNGFAAGAGYDLVTGRGTPISSTLVPHLAAGSVAAPGTPDLTAATDSGVSSTDNITKITTPTFTGTATTGSTVEILSDGVSVGSAVAAASAYTVTVSALANGTHTIQARIGATLSAGSLAVTIDTVAPGVSAGAFHYTGVSAQDLTLTFSEDVSASLSNVDLSLTNTTTSTTIPTANITESYVAGNNGKFAFGAYTYGALPDGNYSAVASTAGVTDIAGNALTSNLTKFFSLAGDFNHDRSVDVADLGILATHWQQSGQPFANGDTTYDSLVNVADLGILATNWQKTLPVAGDPLGPVGALIKLTPHQGDAATAPAGGAVLAGSTQIATSVFAIKSPTRLTSALDLLL